MYFVDTALMFKVIRPALFSFAGNFSGLIIVVDIILVIIIVIVVVDACCNIVVIKIIITIGIITIVSIVLTCHYSEVGRRGLK